METLVNVHAFSVDSSVEDLDTIDINTRTMMMPPGGWNVYASEGYLVLAGEGYNVDILAAEEEDDDDTSVGEQTYVIVYELNGPNIGNVVTATVPGYSLNQFSMDEYQDYLRIATCTRLRWWWVPGETWEAEEESLCEINVLGPISAATSGQLPIVGTEDGIGHAGERIYSVRFQENRGFVVTFRETDPFYTIDLSDPANPTAVGELEVPGFSSYLHTIGENFILGVGQFTNDQGFTEGLQLSLFDVSNFAEPVRVYNYVEDDGSYSDAQFDHRGFRYLPESGLLIIPLTVYGDSDQGNGVDGFRTYVVDVASDNPTIASDLTIEHATGNFYDYGCWSGTGFLAPRSIVYAGGLHTFKAHTIAAHSLADGTEMAGSPFNLDADLSEEDCIPYYFEGQDWVF